jgi:CrcB protein
MVQRPPKGRGDAQLRPPHDETSRDEADLFQARRPLIVSPERVYGLIETFATLSLLGIFSFFGTLIRLGLIAIGSYNGQTVFPLLWPNVVGCTLMGMFTTRKHCIEEM